MLVGEIVGELLAPVFKFIGRILFELFFELLIKGAGYLICRPFKKNIDPDGFLVVVVGLVFWVGVGFSAVYITDFIQQKNAIDRCLNAGERLSEDSSLCESAGE